jgi:multiple sugar transport system ATP-binding protein
MTVRSVEQLGTESYVYGTLDDDTAMTLHQPGQVSIHAGERITLCPQSGQLHLFDAGTGASLRAGA